MPESPFASVGVVGLGLMGASVARRLSADPDGPRVVGVEQDPLRGRRAVEEGIVAGFGLPGDGTLQEVDLVVLAVPLRAAVAFLTEEAAELPVGVAVTDLVGLNEPLLRAAGGAGVASRFVTAHPMSGGEGSGPAASRADLFEGARVWLSATEEADPALRRRIGGFWASLGGEPEWIDSARHDRLVAWVSHLPQLVASALAGALDAAGLRPADLGPGGRDMIRLARSPSGMWRDLLEHSAPVTGTGLTSISRGLEAVADLLARRDVDRVVEFMDLAGQWARGEAALADERDEAIPVDGAEEDGG